MASSAAADETNGIRSHQLDEEKGLHRTTTAVTMSPELFEKIYFTPKTPHVGDYNRRFANPTALGFVGFVISTFTFSIILMGWGGAAGFTPVVGIFFFVGPLLLTFAMVFEWIMGNFLSFMVMGLFSVFWLSFGMLQLPSLGLAAAYATADDPTGLSSKEYNTVLALYLVVWGFALLTFFCFTIMVNILFSLIFFFVTVGAFVLAGAYFNVAQANFDRAMQLQKAGGAILFIVACLGWYAVFLIMSYEMRSPLKLPAGDLSRFWPKTDVPIDQKKD